MIPIVYTVQYCFTVPSMSFGIQTISIFLLGVVSAMTILILENIKTDDYALKVAYDICSVIFLAIPPYNLGMSVFRLSVVFNAEVFATQYLSKHYNLY